MIKKLTLNNFRNYLQGKIETEHARVIILYGENGAGKTNILEAISLLTQSKGFRNSKYEEMVNKNSEQNFWNISIQTNDCDYLTGYIKGNKTGKRIFKVSDKATRDLSEFNKNYNVLWLTYATDRLFIESPSKRRDFIDMLCLTKYKQHMQKVATYEKIARERLAILKINNNQSMAKNTLSWLEILEKKICSLGVEIARSRMNIAEELEHFQFEKEIFPKFKNKMTGELETCIITKGDDELFECYKKELFSRRQKDFYSGSTTFGPNRSDWNVFNLKKNINANLCSAGEQKIILSGVFLSFVANVFKNDSRGLIVLFDDVIAHLDENYRKILFDFIKNIKNSSNNSISFWLSGTGKNLFREFNDCGMFFEIRNNSIKKDG